ncbi:hypothetical protein QL285_081591 [Trifolium repens]|nr:hypothetical protein QL285_081591 [Trifolium repens]
MSCAPRFFFSFIPQISSQNHFAVGMVSRSCTPKSLNAYIGFGVQLYNYALNIFFPPPRFLAKTISCNHGYCYEVWYFNHGAFDFFIM